MNMKKKNAPSEAHLDTARKAAQEAHVNACAEVDAINARLCSALEVARYTYDSACTEAYALHRVAFAVACKKSDVAYKESFDAVLKSLKK
jgi:hypothetical protein